MNELKYVNDVGEAPAAIGPYSQAVISGDLVYLSGQIPLVPGTANLKDGGIENQTEQVLTNIEAILSHLSLSFANVMKTTIFLIDLGHFKAVNEIYERRLGGSKPARSTIQVAALPLGSLVEIEMIARKG